MTEELAAFEKESLSIFKGSKRALMAHTIRAVENVFLENEVALDVMVERDVYRRRILGDVVSVLKTQYQIAAPKPRVTATICLHNDATLHLARYCIAHELYHLILELRGFLNSGRVIWPNLARLSPDEAEKVKKEMMEDECDCFAQRLCKMHDNFYADQKTITENCRFGEGVLDQPIHTRTLSHKDWPLPFNLDPEKAFWKEKRD